MTALKEALVQWPQDSDLAAVRAAWSGEFAVPACRDEDAPEEAKLPWEILQKHYPVVASKVEECVSLEADTTHASRDRAERLRAACRKFFCRASADCVDKVC